MMHMDCAAGPKESFTSECNCRRT